MVIAESNSSSFIGKIVEHYSSLEILLFVEILEDEWFVNNWSFFA